MSMPSRYDYAFDPADDSTAARVCRLVGRQRHVLELGCAAGAMSAVLARHYGCTVIGVDHDAPALEQAAPWCEQTILADLENADWHAQVPAGRINTLLAADILEHMHDPLATLKHLRDHLVDGGELVISVPNIAHGGVIAALLNNDFPYRDTGLLDRTHIHFFTSLTLRALLHRAGFALLTLETVDSGPHHPEFRDYWQRLPAATHDWLAQLPAGRPFQILAKARKSEHGETTSDDLQDATLEWLHEQDTARAAAMDSTGQEIATLTAALAESRQQQDSLQAQLDAMLNSRSWRVTRALRRLADRFR